MIVVWLFLVVSWVCLQFVIVVFPDYTHLLFLIKSCPMAYNWPIPGATCYKENIKIFCSETILPRAMIFGMLHHLVDIYQLCSNNAPEAKQGHTLGVKCFTKDDIGENIKTSSSLKPQGLES